MERYELENSRESKAAKELEHALNAVSYTHLDVYKRQALYLHHQKRKQACKRWQRGVSSSG